jgi:hypothetical protein
MLLIGQDDGRRFAQASQPSPGQATRRKPAWESQLPIHGGGNRPSARAQGPVALPVIILGWCLA